MYKRDLENKELDELAPNKFIKNNDYVNSELLYKLDQFDECKPFIITKNEHRIDLISKEIYGDDRYSWILMYINRVSLKDLVRHKVIYFIPIDKLNEIIDSV